MDVEKCPGCQGSRVAKNGNTPKGAQKYKCLSPGCGRQFVAAPSHLLNPEIKTIVLSLLADSVRPAIIKRAVPAVSMGWIYRLRGSRRRKRK